MKSRNFDTLVWAVSSVLLYTVVYKDFCVLAEKRILYWLCAFIMLKLIVDKSVFRQWIFQKGTSIGSLCLPFGLKFPLQKGFDVKKSLQGDTDVVS